VSQRLAALLVLALLMMGSVSSSAECVCRCVNGKVQAICTSSIDLKPICAPTVCPIVPPSIRPIQSPVVPPIGTTKCRKEQVLNPKTHVYEWKTICR
jgi:hypothetical protein